MTAKPSRLHSVKRGLTLPIAGAPVQKAEAGPRVDRVALLAADYVGMRPRMRVKVGDEVQRGQVLFEDRKTEGVLFTAPAAGTVEAIHRGDKRAFLSLVIALGDTERGEAPAEVPYESYTGRPVAELSADEVRRALVETGMWPALRTRPFGRTPEIDSAPHAIFVTAMDSNPLTADADVVLAERLDAFRDGLAALSRLAGERKLYVCQGAGSRHDVSDVEGVEVHRFKGRHPAGTPGLHIHVVDPADSGRTVWYVGYQDVIAMGHFFATGKQLFERTVALAGPAVEKPRLLVTRVGASLEQLTHGQLKEGENRVISGSVFNGRSAQGEIHGYLGRRDNQVTALAEAGRREFLGWLAPGFGKFSVARLFMSKLLPGKQFAMTTDSNGGGRAMVPIGLYEKVLPFDLMPTFLLRSILAGDVEQAEKLGVLELEEEDLALCTYVCPSKIEFGPALREMLTTIHKEG